ncbi:Transposase and inactivated derivatives, TnpA family [Xenorhabdus koppenhoeferi]|uniref:Transposase and inactivated derivatives, TnpA family n=1 Tax=Xenorhabdus koppenhoeferi TaxID=351659 RepID=A0A1I7K3C4_9GAMM|nr:Tn3 family transposase [Xenorhabdus koppenhoeferi]SFU91934.1 Transposase and inactivated derivatives, TnpA family [Xenorhabdus koppenhoeferi]
MSFLDAKSHDTLFALPELYEEALSRFALSCEDVAFARSHRRSHNRLGFAIQLALIRDLGRTLRAGEAPTEAVTAVVAEQLDIDPAVFTLYAQREETRREHAREIVSALGLRSVQVSDYRMLILAAAREAATTERGLPITRAVINKLKDKKLLVPVPTQLIRLAMAGRAAARRLSYRELIRELESSSITALEQLLTERVGERSLLGWIAEAPEGVKLKNIKGLIARLEVLRAAKISDEQRKRIHVNRYGIIARDSRVLHAREIQRLASERRHATLAAFVIEKQAVITDLAIDMFCKLIGSTRRKAEISQRERRLKAAEVLEVVALDHIKLGQALLAARDGNTDFATAITASLGWEGLIASMAAAASVASPHRNTEFDELIGRHKSLRKLGRLIFGTFSFRAFRPDEPVLLAVGHLRALYHGRKLPNRVPLDFMSRKWQRRVSPVGENTDLQAWEVAVFVHLRDRLKTGDIWVDGSRAWRSFEDYLLPRHVFDQMRAESRLGLAIPDNFSQWRAERTATLNAKLKALAKAAAANAIPDAELSDRGLSVSPVREEDSDRITTLSRKLYMLVPRIRITSLLAEVHSWTNFLDSFTHYRTGEQAEDESALMAAILADATNAGAERMAQSSRGVTIHQMMVMVDRHLRAETYASATSVLVDAQQEHPFAAIWGDGHVSSSDGQFFPAGGRGEASLEYNAKYGKRPGASIYGFLSNRFASFFSRMIQASESEAPYVLDGLLHNESSVEIHEHATDTAGATETTFSMFHSFGYRLIPRIRNLGSRRLYVITPSEEYRPLDALIAGKARMDVIEQHWDEVLRLKASIGAGLVPPSVILKKLAAFPRQNRLNQALREMGRIERSIFICDWLLDTRLRRRSHAILNKGESRHALARAIFLHQLGELRNRAAEAMAYRASGLNLVVNAIVLWNTVYLSRAVDYVRS